MTAWIRMGAAIGLAAIGLAGCAAPRAPVAVAPPPAPAAVVAAALPHGASPGMLVPSPLADGSFPTPNRSLFGDAALWHLRAGLNVAALSCPGAEGEAVRIAYNRWIVAQRVALRAAQARYAAGYPSADAYDDAMTRLYNFWSQTPVRGDFCRAAAGIASEVAGVGAAGMARLAEDRLPALDRPFADFYAAYDAWRRGAAAPVAPAAPVVVAVAAAPAPLPAAMAAAMPAAMVPRPAAPPRRAAAMPAPEPAPVRAPLSLDLSTLPADAEVTGPR